MTPGQIVTIAFVFGVVFAFLGALACLPRGR